MTRYRHPIEFDRARGVFIKLPLPGPCPLLDCEFDDADGLISGLSEECKASGSIAVGIDVLPTSGDGFSSHGYQRWYRQTLAAKQQIEWERQRAQERAAQDAAIEAEWQRQEEMLAKTPRKAAAMALLASLRTGR